MFINSLGKTWDPKVNNLSPMIIYYPSVAGSDFRFIAVKSSRSRDYKKIYDV